MEHSRTVAARLAPRATARLFVQRVASAAVKPSRRCPPRWVPLRPFDTALRALLGRGVVIVSVLAYLCSRDTAAPRAAAAERKTAPASPYSPHFVT